ncbi:MAG: hypothetical protein COB36_05025 [Alphaproteobacteria bacterium]|nr:MAG: hypothetical protein COB36_05025 [Alphaproteobacteria bacterium]
MVDNNDFKSEVSDSRFYMWRTLFSVAHADNVVTDEEIAFMAHILEDIDFSDEQTTILKDDITHPKNVEDMFRGMTDQNDRKEFFSFARDLVWVDGDFGTQEQNVMVKLLQSHFEDIDFDELVGSVALEFEEDMPRVDDGSVSQRKQSSPINAFFRRILGKK